MAENLPTGPIEMGAEMDYAEHDKTYNFFTAFAKIATIVVAALLIAMAFGFFTSAGFISSVIAFVLLSAVGIFVFR